MAGVSKIPTEVLGEIFYLLCKKSIFVCKLNNSYCEEDFPWGVGLVCRQWRTVFLSYPPIWASLKLFDSLETRSESYANEMNRRLALYLERSGGYPLTLDIYLWNDHSKSFTMMALEMLSACAHRWRTVKFGLFREWHVDCILPCKGNLPTLEWLQIRTPAVLRHAWDVFEVAPRLTHANVEPWAENQGWNLPYTQLTELSLLFDGESAFLNCDVLDPLSMLHNVKELRLRFNFYYKLYSEVGLSQFAPRATLLNRLRVLEIPHPAILSWFKTPSLCDLSFADYQNNDEPLDIHGQISSLIQRSGCQIRKLSFWSCRKVHVGTLKDVEEIEIHAKNRTCSSTDISSLPRLRFLTIIGNTYTYKNIELLANSIVMALKSARVTPRNECSACTPISCLERVTVELCLHHKDPKIPKRLLEIADKWPLVVFRIQRS